nr:PREDICTED: protein NYNRIN-like [Latimeria chalumnae]|eukprot:XP_014339960.1 PREDICTED: protein NYNRIN-like [Latimeria chalumnae]
MFTRWIEAFPTHRNDALTTAKILWEQIFTRWGFPRHTESDNGPHFIADVMKTMCTMLGIQQAFHIPYRPHSSGIVECFNQTLKSGLKKAILESTDIMVKSSPDWVQTLPGVLMAIRATTVRTTGHSPYELMTGRPVPIMHPCGVLLPTSTNYQHQQFFAQLQEVLQAKLLSAAHNMGISHSRSAIPHSPIRPIQFQFCDSVMLKKFLKGGGWDTNWEGPYEVIDHLGPNVQLAITKRGRPKQMLWFHGDQCKMYEKQQQTDKDDQIIY